MSGILCRKESRATVVGNRCERNCASGIAAQANVAAQFTFNVTEDNAYYGIWFGPNTRPYCEKNSYLHNGEICEGESLNLFMGRQFNDLETIAARLRRDKTMSHQGEWQLCDFHEGIISRCMTMTALDESSFMARLQEWKKAYPQSVACAIAEAGALEDFGWRERGGGFANTVTPQGWAGFRSYLNKALAVIEAAEKLPEKDPHLYSLKMGILLGLGKDEPESNPTLSILSWWTNVNLIPPSPLEQAFLKGISVSPTYYPLYYARVRSLLPRWGGSSNEIVNFANNAAAACKEDGPQLYARIAWTTLYMEGKDTYRSKYRFSWPRIRKGYRDLLKQYPDSGFRLNTFCCTACLYGDRGTARDLFEKINGNWDGGAWENEAHFNRWQAWALEKKTNPVGSPLERAVLDDDAQEVARLLKAGADPNGLAEDGRSLLVVAIRENCNEAAKALVENGADVNFVPAEGTQPIAAAAWNEDDDTMLHYLIEHKANPNVVPPTGRSPLIYSIGRDRADRVKYLLDHGANPEDSVLGQRAITHAVFLGNLEMVKALVEKGADVNKVDDPHLTPLRAAIQAKKDDIAAYLREHGAKE
jgi:hypothetical protein